jgi:hypothetical protein
MISIVKLHDDTPLDEEALVKLSELFEPTQEPETASLYEFFHMGEEQR